MSSQSLLNVSDSHAFLLEPRREESRGAALPNRAVLRKPMMLGLPCARCRAYYAAELCACPICGCTKRVPAGGSWTGSFQPLTGQQQANHKEDL